MLLRFPALLLACLLVALTGCTSLQGTGDKGFVTGEGRVAQLEPDERDAAVDMAGEDLEGRAIDLDQFSGTPLVVVVWGSWCTPCRAEIDEVVDAAHQLEGTADFLGINIRDASTAQALAFQRAHDVPYASVYSPDGKALLPFAGTLTPNSIPSFVVLDGDGRVAASIIGSLPSVTTLVDVVEEVAAEDG